MKIKKREEKKNHESRKRKGWEERGKKKKKEVDNFHQQGVYVSCLGPIRSPFFMRNRRALKRRGKVGNK